MLFVVKTSNKFSTFLCKKSHSCCLLRPCSMILTKPSTASKIASRRMVSYVETASNRRVQGCSKTKLAPISSQDTVWIWHHRQLDMVRIDTMEMILALTESRLFSRQLSDSFLSAFSHQPKKSWFIPEWTFWTWKFYKCFLKIGGKF